MGAPRYTPKQLQEFRDRFLPNAVDLATAYEAASRAWGIVVTPNGLRQAFRHLYRKPVSEFVGKALATPDLLLDQFKAKQETSKLRRERDDLVRELVELKAQRDFFNAINDAPVEPIVRRETKSGLREAAMVVLMSDWHVEETILPEKVNGKNEFNLAIADKRIHRLVDGVLWLLDLYNTKIEIRDLVVWLGGDFISGYIHPDLVQSNQLGPVESIIWVRDRLHYVLEQLAAADGIEKLTVVTNYGNHGRTTDKSRISTGAENSYEWMLYQMLDKHYINNDKIQFAITRGQLSYVDIYDYTIRFTHGDNIRYFGGIGGLTIPVIKAIRGWDTAKHADLTCMGHYHQYLSTNQFVANGSLCGYGPYSVAIRADYEPPRQATFLIDPKHGKCLETPLWVD